MTHVIAVYFSFKHTAQYLWHLPALSRLIVSLSLCITCASNGLTEALSQPDDLWQPAWKLSYWGCAFSVVTHHHFCWRRSICAKTCRRGTTLWIFYSAVEEPRTCCRICYRHPVLGIWFSNSSFVYVFHSLYPSVFLLPGALFQFEAPTLKPSLQCPPLSARRFWHSF